MGAGETSEIGDLDDGTLKARRGDHMPLEYTSAMPPMQDNAELIKIASQVTVTKYTGMCRQLQRRLQRWRDLDKVPGTGGGQQAPSSNEEQLADQELHDLQDYTDEMLDEKMQVCM